MSSLTFNSDSVRGPMSSSNPTCSIPEKPSGSKDIGWEYGKLTRPDSYNYVECKKCGKRFTGGVNRIKQHIAWQLGNVKGCEKSTTEDMTICSQALQESRRKKNEKREEENKMR